MNDNMLMMIKHDAQEKKKGWVYPDMATFQIRSSYPGLLYEMTVETIQRRSRQLL